MRWGDRGYYWVEPSLSTLAAARPACWAYWCPSAGWAGYSLSSAWAWHWPDFRPGWGQLWRAWR